MIDRNARRLGLAWEPGLTNGFIHDGWVEGITHPNAFRDATVAIKSPWYWDLSRSALPSGVTYDQVRALRLVYRFKDVARFEVIHERVERERPDGVETRSYLADQEIDRQTIYLWSEVDGEPSIQSATDAHGGHFRSVRMELWNGCNIVVVFRDCLCLPSDWNAYEAWASYPLESGTQVPPLRNEELSTLGRYVPEHRRHMCTTLITQTSATSPEVESFYLCDECVDDWIADYAPTCEIPRVEVGSGMLTKLHGSSQQWERGRFRDQKCNCWIRRPVD